jgi:hypothetical protein
MHESEYDKRLLDSILYNCLLNSFSDEYWYTVNELLLSPGHDIERHERALDYGVEQEYLMKDVDNNKYRLVYLIPYSFINRDMKKHAILFSKKTKHKKT